MSLSAPGWYPDPEGRPGQERYWDGRQWTDQRRYTTPGHAGSTAMVPAGRQGWIARHKKLSGVLAVLLLLWLVGVATGDEPPDDADNVGASQEQPEPSDSTDPEPEATDALEPEDEPSEAPSTPTPKPKPKPSAKPAPSPKVEPEPLSPRTYLVSRVIDGDTVELGDGRSVRLVGIDTPEVGECGSDQATANLERLILRQRVRLTISDEDKDRYGRLLRYVNLGPQDAGLRLIKNGLAIARYDSRDGYGFHPREPAYIAADRASKNFRCPPPAPAPPSGGGNCAVGYSPCVRPYPPDLDCGDVEGPISVTGTDPHGLDAEGDGVGCE